MGLSVTVLSIRIRCAGSIRVAAAVFINARLMSSQVIGWIAAITLLPFLDGHYLGGGAFGNFSSWIYATIQRPPKNGGTLRPRREDRKSRGAVRGDIYDRQRIHMIPADRKGLHFFSDSCPPGSRDENIRSRLITMLRHPSDLTLLCRTIGALPILILPSLEGFPSGWTGLLCGTGVWFLLSDMNFLLHQHVHRPWTTSGLINSIVNLVLSITTGMSASNWKIAHVLRHHKGNDVWGKGYEWEMRAPSILGAVSYCARGVPIVLLRPLLETIAQCARFNRTDNFLYPKALIEQTAVLFAMCTLTYAGPMFYFPYYFTVLFLSRLTDYQNHAGCDSSDPYDFSNNCLANLYNLVRCNFGYHSAHHYFPNAHWTELPRLHELIAHRLPKHRLTYSPWTGFWTPPLLAHWIRRVVKRNEV